MQYCSEDYIITIIKNTKYLSCTYLWLTQYLTVYSHILNTDRSEIIKTIIMLINSLPYKNNASCNFERRIDLCSRSKFTIKDIWSKSDYYIFNKKLQIALKILTYLISLSSIVTNLLVIVTILKKGNNELYKGLKQYSYLYLNSLFSLLISSIMILSWTTECFYPFEVFCPEFRKLVFFQYFKILFRECFVTAFKFMCNFCYIAFAVNRISLLGKDHGNVVTFISEVGIKKYLSVAFLVSLVLSAVKFFKYEINLYNDELNFPTSNEMDIFTVYNKRSKEAALFDAFFIINSISDVINYVVLVLVCFSIDISMVVQLRNVLADKLAKYAAMTHNESKIESKKEENEKIVSKAVKMVVINTAVGVLFKAPLCFIPIVNVYAEFYYKSPVTRYIAPKFGEFYSGLFDTGFYETVIALADLFYMISITIQLFIFIRFDKKFKQGFDKLRKAENKKAQQGKCDNPSIISKKGTK